MTVFETKTTASVSSFDEFSDALKLESVTEIRLASDITFTGSVNSVPIKEVIIKGNNHKITTGGYTIYGESDTTNSGVITFQNLTIEGNDAGGRVFEHNSTGWNVNFDSCVYRGARLVHLSRGTLTFLGSNTVTTTAENAWVENVVFAENCTYIGTAGLNGDFSAFYFNGNAKNGRASVGINSNVTLNIGDDKHAAYPAFYDRVELIEIAEGATLTINSYGYAIHFNRSDMENNAKVIVYTDATLTLNSAGGKNHEAVRYDHTGTIEVEDGGSLYITSAPESTDAAVIRMDSDSKIKLGQVTGLKIYNQTASAPLFDTSDTGFSIDTVDTFSVWGLNGGDYDTAPLSSWYNVKMSTSIDGDTSSNTTSTDDGMQENFQMSAYGCIAAEFFPPAKK